MVALGGLPSEAMLDVTNVAVHGAQASPPCPDHVCPAHEQPARSQPACVEHMIMRWQVLLHGYGEAARGSATSGLLHMPTSMPPHRYRSSCILLTACASLGITGGDAPEHSDVTSQCLARVGACRSSWRSPHSLPVSFDSVVLAIRVGACSADAVQHVPIALLELNRPSAVSLCTGGLLCKQHALIGAFRGQSEQSPCVPSTVGSRHLIRLMDTCSMSRVGYWIQ